MARYTGSKHKLCRREGVSLCGLDSCPVRRKGAVPPGMHGRKFRKRLSDYGVQLREKQKVKRLYGVLEKQFRRYFEVARKNREATGEVLLQLLETRLDNIIYRLSFAPTRPMARQLVTHGHVLVDGKKIDIPSFSVKSGQVVSLQPKAQEIPTVKMLLEDKDVKVPSWLERKAAVGKIVRIPERNDIDATISESLIVEFYSR
ncbi:MAG TPA: 30S ribosomal protein S4 [Patescibacteria group bacterium]|nr:30S ribosomal protein S4 [Patescibacteria group bacterium]